MAVIVWGTVGAVVEVVVDGGAIVGVQAARVIMVNAMIPKKM